MLVLRFIAATCALISRSLYLSLYPTYLSSRSLCCCLILWRAHKNAIRLNAKLIKATWATKPINPTHLPRPREPPTPPPPSPDCAQMHAILIEIIEIISTAHTGAWYLLIDCLRLPVRAERNGRSVYFAVPQCAQVLQLPQALPVRPLFMQLHSTHDFGLGSKLIWPYARGVRCVCVIWLSMPDSLIDLRQTINSLALAGLQSSEAAFPNCSWQWAATTGL